MCWRYYFRNTESSQKAQPKRRLPAQTETEPPQDPHLRRHPYSSKQTGCQPNIGSIYKVDRRSTIPVCQSGRPEKSERPVGVPAARGHGGDGGAVFEVPPGSKVRVANPWNPHRESTCRMPLASGGVDRPSVQLVPVRKYLRHDSCFVRHGTEWAALVRQRCCVFPAVIRSPQQIVRSSPAG